VGHREFQKYFRLLSRNCENKAEAEVANSKRRQRLGVCSTLISESSLASLCSIGFGVQGATASGDALPQVHHRRLNWVTSALSAGSGEMSKSGYLYYDYFFNKSCDDAGDDAVIAGRAFQVPALPLRFSRDFEGTEGVGSRVRCIVRGAVLFALCRDWSR